MPFFNQGIFRNAAGPIDKEAESKWLIFRFTDFKETAQRKFAEQLKRDSSVLTIRRDAKVDDLLTVLRDLDPILFHPGWGNKFSGSTFFRWREQRLSSIIYHSMFRREVRNPNNWAIGYLLETPRPCLESAGRMFTCNQCGSRLPYAQMSYDANVCDGCRNSGPNRPFSWAKWRKHYAKRRDLPLPRMRGGDNRTEI